MAQGNGPQTRLHARRVLSVVILLFLLSSIPFLGKGIPMNSPQAEMDEVVTEPPIVSEEDLKQVVPHGPEAGKVLQPLPTRKGTLQTPSPEMTVIPTLSVTPAPGHAQPKRPASSPTATLLHMTFASPTWYPAPTFARAALYPTKSAGFLAASRTPRPAKILDTAVPTATPSETKTATFSLTSSKTATPTKTTKPTKTSAPSRTPTVTRTPSPTKTPAPTRTPSPTKTLSPTRTPSPTKSSPITPTPSITHTPTRTKTPSKTPSFTPVHSATFTSTSTNTLTIPASGTLPFTPSLTATITQTASMTATEPLSSPESPTATPSFTPVPSLTAIVCSTGTPAGFIPSDDAYIDSASPTTVFGAGNALDVRPDNDADRRGLLRFDLSSIPPNATVTEATLYLYESSSLTGQTTYIYRLTSDWEEQSVTWQSWQTPGGDFDRSFSYLSYSPQQSNCMLALDITSLASAWVNGTFPNQGLMLYSTGPDQGISYSSKEHETAGQWPRLDVHYRVVPSEP